MGPRERRQLGQDITLAAMVGALALAEVWVPFDSVAGSGSPAVTTVGIVVESVLLALRRRRPILLAGVPLIWIIVAIATGGQLQVVFFGQLVALGVALYSVARHGSRRDIAAVAGVTALMLLLGDLFLTPLRQASEILFHWGVVGIVFCVGLGMRASEHRAVAAAVRASEAEATAREASLRAVAEERSRIARELHDILGHSVSLMVVQAGAAAQVVDDDPAFVRRALEAIRTTGTESLDEVRRVLALLRTDGDPALSPQPGLAQLDALLDQARADGLAIEVIETGERGPLAAGLELAAYRIVQESLTNVRKHAGARHVVVRLARDANGVDVTVTDDGPGEGRMSSTGPAERRAAGHGLVGMRERAALYGGSVQAGPTSSGGWQVRAVLPAAGPR